MVQFIWTINGDGRLIEMKKITRKQFLKISIASLAGIIVSKPLLAALKFIPEIIIHYQLHFYLLTLTEFIVVLHHGYLY